jgi:hypothetical protein
MNLFSAVALAAAVLSLPALAEGSGSKKQLTGMMLPSSAKAGGKPGAAPAVKGQRGRAGVAPIVNGKRGKAGVAPIVNGKHGKHASQPQ